MLATADDASTERVRSFNRTVTERIGALQDEYLARGRALGASRVLWEIGPDGADLRVLRARLGLDSGYLSRLLRALERDGLVARRAYRQVPPKVEYSLTELGGSLCAPVKQLRTWAEEHIEDIRGARARYDDNAG